jgi:hypothetical protein
MLPGMCAQYLRGKYYTRGHVPERSSRHVSSFVNSLNRLYESSLMQRTAGQGTLLRNGETMSGSGHGGHVFPVPSWAPFPPAKRGGGGF